MGKDWKRTGEDGMRDMREASLEFAVAEICWGDVDVAACLADVAEEGGEGGIEIEQLGIAHENHTEAGAGQGHVEFAVNGLAAFLEGVVGEKIQLVGMLYGETIYNIVALAALVALHGVDGHFVQTGNAEAVQLVAHGGYLSAVGHDDTDTFFGPCLGLEATDARHDGGYHACLGGVGLLGLEVGACLLGFGPFVGTVNGR